MLVRGKLPTLPSEEFVENDNAITLFTPFGVEKYCTFCVVQYNIVICLEQTSFIQSSLSIKYARKIKNETKHGSLSGIFFSCKI